MPHVDEGRLTAWLDGALAPGDPVGAEIARHLETCADCRRRLEEARELRGQTEAILAAAEAPPSRAPGFARLAARAGSGPTPDGARGPRRRRRWSVPATGLAWAASVALAVSAGWLARDLSLRRGEGAAPFAGAPAVPEPGPPGPAVREEGREPKGEALEPPTDDIAVSAARQKERGTADAGEAPAARAAPEPSAMAAVAAESDPFHAPPDPEAGRAAGAPDATGCWERESGAEGRGLPERIRLAPAARSADGTQGAADAIRGREAQGLVSEAGGGVVAHWAEFGPDSVWIGGAGPETLRMRLEGDRLAGLSRARPGKDGSPEARADTERGAAAVPVAWRRVPCEP